MQDEMLILLISSSPVIELRGAIPLGIAKGLSVEKVFLLSILGNIIPIIPLLALFRWVIDRLEHLKFVGRILQLWFDRVEKKSKLVYSYGFWGLVLLVAIPLPGTGVWTGTAAATLLNFPRKRAVLAIFLGVIIAAIIVTLASLGIVNIAKIDNYDILLSCNY